MVKFRRYPRRHFYYRFRIPRPSRPLKTYPGTPLPFRYVLLLSLVFFLFSTSLGLWIVNRAIKPTLIAYAESQSVNLATHMMNQAIKEEIGEGLNLSEIIKVVPYGNSTLTTFDTDKITTVANNIADRVLKNINEMERGEVFSPAAATGGEIEEVTPKPGEGIEFQIPLGKITNNVLLANFGPDIPIRFKAIGHIEYDIKTITKEHQINSTWYEVRLHMKVGIQMLVPFTSEIITVPRNVLLASGEIKGDVPQFYGNHGQLTPSVIIPDKEKKDSGKNRQ